MGWSSQRSVPGRGASRKRSRGNVRDWGPGRFANRPYEDLRDCGPPPEPAEQEPARRVRCSSRPTALLCQLSHHHCPGGNYFGRARLGANGCILVTAGGPKN